MIRFLLTSWLWLALALHALAVYSTSDTYRLEFQTRSPATGALQDADALPTGVLVVNGVDNGATVTVTDSGTGRYKASVPLSGLSANDEFYLRFAATVDGIADELTTGCERVGVAEVTGGINTVGGTVTTLDAMRRADTSLYRYVGASGSYTLTFAHADVTEGETPYVAVQRVSDGRYYNHITDSLIDVSTITSSIWTTQVVRDLVGIQGASSLVTGLYGTNEPYTALPAGFYYVTVREGEGIDDRVLGAACVYWDGSAWGVPEAPTLATLGVPAAGSIAEAVEAVETNVNENVIALLHSDPQVSDDLIWVIQRKDGALRGSHAIPTNEGDDLLVCADFGPVLGDDEVVSSVAAITLVSGFGLTLSAYNSDDVEIVGGRFVKFRVSEGTAADVPYKIKLQVTTNTPNTLTPTLEVRVND